MEARFLLIAIVALSLFHRGCSQCTMTNPCADQLGQGQNFQETTQQSSSAASWAITMNVNIATITYNWLELKRRTYNGAILGPTWVVKPGDTLTVTLNNQLSSDGNDLGNALNQNNYPNSTNLHTHGLHISSQDPQDNVLKHIGPGTSYQYVYQILSSQPAGTYWYHAHLHGSTMFQVQGGLSGMLIVEDTTEVDAQLAAASCPGNCDKDIQMLFQPILIFSGNRGFGALQDNIQDYTGFQHDSYTVTTGGTLTNWLSANVNFFTCNGQLQPNLAMATGELYRFRMVNAGGDASLEVYITDSSNVRTTNCDIREIAIDGVYLDAPREMHDQQSLLVPATRVDWLVKCNVAGTYKLRSFADTAHTLSIGTFTRYTGDLVTLTVSGTVATSSFPTSLPTRPSYLTDLQNVADSNVEGRFVVELNPATYLNRQKWSGPGNYRFKMTVGTVQEWYLTNTDTSTSHPLHIHINHFQVISYNNYTGGYGTGAGDAWTLVDIDDQATACFYQREGIAARKRRSLEDETPLRRMKRQGPGGGGNNNNVLQYWGHDTRFAADAGNTLGYSRLGDWRDVLLVPPLANITIRFNADEFTGDVIIHCHILSHEDAGMMMVTEIVSAGSSLNANITSGNAFPGTCGECDRVPFNNVTRLCDSGANSLNNFSHTTLLFSVLLALALILWTDSRPI